MKYLLANTKYPTPRENPTNYWSNRRMTHNFRRHYPPRISQPLHQNPPRTSAFIGHSISAWPPWSWCPVTTTSRCPDTVPRKYNYVRLPLLCTSSTSSLLPTMVNSTLPQNLKICLIGSSVFTSLAWQKEVQIDVPSGYQASNAIDWKTSKEQWNERIPTAYHQFLDLFDQNLALNLPEQS